MASYYDLLAQVMNEIDDFQKLSTDEVFEKSLCELCLCLVCAMHKPQSVSAGVVFYSNNPPNSFQYLSLIDIYLGGDANLGHKDFMQFISAYSAEGSRISYGGLESVKYSKDSITQTSNIPKSIYQVCTNLFGILPTPALDAGIQMNYVPYIEIRNLNEEFPLDHSYIKPLTDYMRLFLLLRYRKYDLAKLELKRIVDDKHP